MAKKTVQPHTHTLIYTLTHTQPIIHTLRQEHTQFVLRLGDCFTPPTATLAIWLCTLCVTVRIRDDVSVWCVCASVCMVCMPDRVCLLYAFLFVFC